MVRGTGVTCRHAYMHSHAMLQVIKSWRWERGRLAKQVFTLKLPPTHPKFYIARGLWRAEKGTHSTHVQPVQQSPD